MNNLNSIGEYQYGNPLNRLDDTVVKIEDPWTGNKSTIFLPGKGPVPRVGDTFDDGINRGTVVETLWS
jgi:hypothetical protein